MKKHKNAAHLRCRAMLEVGFTVDFETGDIYDPDGEKLAVYFHASKDNRPQIRCRLGVSEFYMKVHRFVAYGERVFKDGFEVHHIDGNRKNNRLDNLALVEASEHDRIHRRFKLE